MKLTLIILLVLFTFYHGAFSQCNGCESLCDKKYNEVAYLTTHNAYNSKEDGFKLPNQKWNITTENIHEHYTNYIFLLKLDFFCHGYLFPVSIFIFI